MTLLMAVLIVAGAVFGARLAFSLTHSKLIGVAAFLLVWIITASIPGIVGLPARYAWEHSIGGWINDNSAVLKSETSGTGGGQ